MPRYGPPPSDDAPPPPADDDKSSLTRWSLGARVLAVLVGVLIVTAFVFEFLPPTSSGSSKKISTTVAVTSTSSTELSTTIPASTTSSTPATTTTR